MDETLNTIPTVGFNVETIKYKKMNLNVWDVGGQDSIRSLWRHYYTGTHVSMPLNSGFSVLMVQIYFRGLSVSVGFQWLPLKQRPLKALKLI